MINSELIVEIRSMSTTLDTQLTTQSVINLELVRIHLGFSSSDIINYLHYLSVTI